MDSNIFNHFVCITAGDNPDELMTEYGIQTKSGKKVVVLPFEKAPQFRQNHIYFYKSLLKSQQDELTKLHIETELEFAQNASDTEFFEEKTKDKEHDPETGDVITFENPDGKWKHYNIGQNFSNPFILKNGGGAYQARKRDIDWEKIHLYNQELYETTWDLVMSNKTPQNEQEKLLYENMKNKESYFLKYGDKETYVICNTAFWGYAFNSETTGWRELEPNVSQYVWVKNFYDLFIKTLPDDTLLTIYECTK